MNRYYKLAVCMVILIITACVTLFGNSNDGLQTHSINGMGIVQSPRDISQITADDRISLENRLAKQNPIPLGTYDHLIVVAGHSVLSAGATDQDIITSVGKNPNEPTYDPNLEEKTWHVAPYQLKQELGLTIGQHLQLGIEVLRKDDKSLLVVSGGQTRLKSGHVSEAGSYKYVIDIVKDWGLVDDTPTLGSNRDQRPAGGRDWDRVQDWKKLRVFSEMYARDSLTNLLYSIERFRELANRYPAKITAVSFHFKEDRFKFHMQTLGWDMNSFDFIGYSPSALQLDQALIGEEKTVSAFKADPIGCGADLFRKRNSRDPFHQLAGKMTYRHNIEPVVTCVDPSFRDFVFK